MSFRKELAISAQSPVGKKDLKMLRKGIAGAFPRLTAAQLDAVLPLSDDWSALKLKGSGTILYQRTGKPPAFFDLEGRDDLWPSLYTLWVLPEMLPSLEIYGPVSRHLLKGADLMLPGVIVPERDGLPRFTPGARLAVRVAGNAFPIAVGSATLSNVDAAAGGMKGKGMLIAHVFRDALWSFGGRTTPNAGFGLEEVGECAEGDSAAALAGVVAGLAETTISAAADDSSDDEAAADGAAAAAGGGGGGGGEAGSAESAAVEQLSALSMDELLLETLLNAACSTLLEPKALPLDVADVYAKHMQLAKPASVSLDAKRSTYKQLTKFFKAMQKSKLLATKEHKSDIKVLSFDREHPLLKDFAPSWPLATSAAAPTGAGGPHAPTDGGASSGGGGGELELELAALTRSTAPRTSELVGPTHYTEKLWAAASLPKSALLSREDAFERVLFAYIDAHKLEAGAGADAAAAAGAAEEEDDWEKAADGGAAGAQGGSAAGAVLLDELLIESLWKVAGGKKKGDEYPRHVPSEDAEERFEARLQVWHRVEVDGHEPRDRKGPLPRVQIALGRAAGHNKTTVSGLETFRIDPDDLARYGKRLFNCTASVAELPGKNVHEKEVTLQGHCVSELVDHLAKVYKLPRSLIDIKR